MSDQIDVAADTTTTCTAEAERRARGLSGPEYHPVFDGKTCVECGEDIPAKRLAMRKVRCVDCQTELETRVRMEPINRRVQ